MSRSTKICSTAELVPGSGRRAQHQAEQRRAKDAEHAAGNGANQPPQRERPHAQLEDDDRACRDRPDDRAFPTRLDAERAEEITNRGK